MMMCTAVSAETTLNYICFPWSYKGSTLNKVAAWATFFFLGWICYPIYGLSRVYQRLIGGGKIHSIAKEILYTDPISKGLAIFNNSGVQGQINGIYITTNETNLAAISQVLEEHPRPIAQTIHIGCATWHNLDIMCARRSTYGLIVDFNPKNCEFIWKTIEIVSVCNSREEFKQAMNNYLNSLEGEQRELFFHKDQRGLPTDRIEQELAREGSWLHSNEAYQYIKQLVSQGRLIAITENITNFEQFSNIRSFLDRNNITIDSLYMSNICNFMGTSNKRSLFVKTVKHLLNNNTIFINCPTLKLPSTSNKTILHQQFTLGKEILSITYNSENMFEKAFN